MILTFYVTPLPVTPLPVTNCQRLYDIDGVYSSVVQSYSEKIDDF